ncbi:hypothetical protein [Rhizomonospora bruguierae]|uniref:hypothetical protein n=1 Tax=Rhizomonospora bruguierae TaxID=1581705 RepID=UPI001BCEAE23|nr:hypothetical protein [Micromonospora sp. NBRC 107566]
MTEIEQLMRRLAEAGATAILKVDHERLAQGGEYWTFIVSGGTLGEGGLVRAEEATLAECLRIGLSRLASYGPQWHWVSEFFDLE